MENFNFSLNLHISFFNSLSPFCTFWRKYRSNEGRNFAAVFVRSSSSSLPISELSLVDIVTKWIYDIIFGNLCSLNFDGN